MRVILTTKSEHKTLSIADCRLPIGPNLVLSHSVNVSPQSNYQYGLSIGNRQSAIGN
jgi:hypothetical protein